VIEREGKGERERERERERREKCGNEREREREREREVWACLQPHASTFTSSLTTSVCSVREEGDIS
jgi:hypothetical protein